MHTTILNAFRSIFLTVIITILPAITITSLAEESTNSRLQWGIDTGMGYSLSTTDKYTDKPVSFFLGFKGGYILNPQYLIGIELSGWLFEAGNLWDPSKGAGLNQSFITGQFYLHRNSRLYIKLGSGYASEWKNNMGSEHLFHGWGTTAGIGYDRTLTNGLILSPFIVYSYSITGSYTHYLLTSGVGLMIKQ